MGTCANTSITRCQGQEIPFSDLFQGIQGSLFNVSFMRKNFSNDAANICANTSNSATFPGDNGQQATWFVTATGIQIAANTLPDDGQNPNIGNYDLIICGQDNGGIIGPCPVSVTVKDSSDPFCINGGGNNGGTCIGLTVNDGATITPGQVMAGATAFDLPVVQGVNGTSFFGDSSTSITVNCTGTQNGTINLRINGNVCQVNVNCNGNNNGNCTPPLNLGLADWMIPLSNDPTARLLPPAISTSSPGLQQTIGGDS